MTTILTRLMQARAGIQLIDKYISDHKLTEDSFVNAQMGSIEYMVRAAILKEFEAVAENLNFSDKDKEEIKKSSKSGFPDDAYWKLLTQMYGMRNIVAHRYGVTSMDFKVIWGALTKPQYMPKVGQGVEQMIKERS